VGQLQLAQMLVQQFLQFARLGHEIDALTDALTRAFSVYTQTEGGTISHGLATAFVAPDGKIDKIWRGNAWTPAEVIEAIRMENR
jgi:cytochrome oxidase Cu insertion factor (SCO1/SenC/PrrC family)